MATQQVNPCNLPSVKPRFCSPALALLDTRVINKSFLSQPRYVRDAHLLISRQSLESNDIQAVLFMYKFFVVLEDFSCYELTPCFIPAIVFNV